MLTLLLLRHAQAVAQGPGDDAERALTEGGSADAVRLGQFLADRDLRPDRALVSPALRTRQTLQGLEKGEGRAVPVAYEAVLYNATSTQMRGVLGGVRDDTRTLLLLGHNPGVMELALAIADDGDRQDFDAMRARFPPCSLAVITFDRESWEDARYGGGRLERFVTPDTLRARS